MFGLENEKLTNAVKMIRDAAEQRSNYLTASAGIKLDSDRSLRDPFYDALATFAEEALKEINRAKIGF